MSKTEITETDKRDRIKSISDEVNEFHPLLEGVFKLLPGTQHVYYTHGPAEKGADFIIEKKDEVMDETLHVFVIVKIGKISKDLAKIGVMDQITECKQARVLPGGRRSVNAGEIWIVTNNEIIQTARDIIKQEFQGKIIKFVEVSLIIDWITKYRPNYWMDIPVDIGDYLEGVVAKVNEKERSFTMAGVNCDVYIDQTIMPIVPQYENHVQRLKRKLTSSPNIYSVIENNKFTIIEGEPGFGKSKLLRHLVGHYCMPVNYLKQNIVPIHKGILEFDISNPSIVKDLICEAGFEINNKKGLRFLILIDGLDELKLDDGEKKDRLLKMRDVICGYSNVHVVITTRPLNLFERNTDLRVGISWQEIKPLSIRAMMAFVAQICKKENVSERLIQDIKKSSLFKQLPRSPIAAILLAKVLEDKNKDLPSNLTELYSKYTELMLGRWDILKGMQSQKEYDAAVAIITQISTRFFDEGLSYIAVDEAREMFKVYLEQRHLGVDGDILFDKLTSRSGIITIEPAFNRCAFKHRTFTEYFYALSRTKKIWPDFIDRRIYDPYYKNTYFFYVGLHKDCEEILDKFMSIAPVAPYERFYRVVFMADYFLAAYATPYEYIKKCMSTLIKEYAVVYTDVIYNRTEHDLNKTPELICLWIFQAMGRYSYGHDFFKDALPEVGLNIMTDRTLTAEQKSYAGFFLSTIGIELKVKNPLDGLLDGQTCALPITVQMGISYESKNMKDRSKALKQQDRKFRRLQMSGDKKITDMLNALQSTPLEDIQKSRERNAAKTNHLT